MGKKDRPTKADGSTKTDSETITLAEGIEQLKLSRKATKTALDEAQVSAIAAKLPPLKRSMSEAPQEEVALLSIKTKSLASPRRSGRSLSKEHGSGKTKRRKRDASPRKKSKTHASPKAHASPKRSASKDHDPRLLTAHRKGSADASPGTSKLRSPDSAVSPSPQAGVKLVNDVLSKMELEVGVVAESEEDIEALKALQPLVRTLRQAPGLRASMRRQKSIGTEFLLKLKPTALKASMENLPARIQEDPMKTPSGQNKLTLMSNGNLNTKALKLERKRQRVLSEMLKTETTFFEALQTVTTLFIAPLQKMMGTPAAVMDADDFELAFQNIGDIRTLNGELLKQMSKRKQKSESMLWCDMVEDWLSNPDVSAAYQRYINGYERARKFLSAAVKQYEELSQLPDKEKDRQRKEFPDKYKHASLGEFIKRRLTHTLCGGFGSITSFLITPVQRFPRYLLFLRELDMLTPVTHPDRGGVERSFRLLKKVTSTIDERKNVYDAIYHKEALLMSFSQDDQQALVDMSDADRPLLAEGPLLEGDEVRYVLIFSDMIVCATKTEDGLRLEWMVSAYTSEIDVRASVDGEYLYVKELDRYPMYPFRIATEHILYPFADGPFSPDFWKPHFTAVMQPVLSLKAMVKIAQQMATDFTPLLINGEDWNTLSIGMKTRAMLNGSAVFKQGDVVECMYIVREGSLSLSLAVDGKDDPIKLGVVSQGQFALAQHLLQRKYSKVEFSASVQDFVKLTELPFRVVQQLLAKDLELAARVYFLLGVVLSSRYLSALADDRGSFSAYAPPWNLHDLGGEVDAEDLPTAKLNLDATDKDIFYSATCFNNKRRKKKDKVQMFFLRKHFCLSSDKKCLHLAAGGVVKIANVNSDQMIISLHIPKTRGLVDLHFGSPLSFNKALREFEALIGRSQWLDRSLEDRRSIELTDDEFDILMDEAEENEYGLGDYIVREGTYPGALVQVIEVSSATSITRSVQESVRRKIRSGDMFGVLPLLTGLPSTTSVRCSGSVVTRCIKYESLLQALDKNPSLAPGFFKLMACLMKRRVERVHSERLRKKTSASSSSESEAKSAF